MKILAILLCLNCDGKSIPLEPEFRVLHIRPIAVCPTWKELNKLAEDYRGEDKALVTGYCFPTPDKVYRF